MSRKTLPGPGEASLPLVGLDLPPTQPLEGEIPLYGVGPHTSVVEGLTMLNGVVKEIARARSNIGFLKLPEVSQPVRNFAEKIHRDTTETQHMVLKTVDNQAGNPHFTHYEKAQWRLNNFNQKQRSKALNDPRVKAIGGVEIADQMLPQSVGELEHRFFYANNPQEAKAKERQRRKIATFVRKHS